MLGIPRRDVTYYVRTFACAANGACSAPLYTTFVIRTILAPAPPSPPAVPGIMSGNSGFDAAAPVNVLKFPADSVSAINAWRCKF